MRLLVCGSRGWTDRRSIRTMLEQMLDRHSDKLVVISGGAPGADTCAYDIAHDLGLRGQRNIMVEAEWDRYRPTEPGRRNPAGIIRNQRMLDEFDPEFVVAYHDEFDSKRGTYHMTTIAKAAGLPVWLYSHADGYKAL